MVSNLGTRDLQKIKCVPSFLKTCQQGCIRFSHSTRDLLGGSILLWRYNVITLVLMSFSRVCWQNTLKTSIVYFTLKRSIKSPQRRNFKIFLTRLFRKVELDQNKRRIYFESLWRLSSVIQWAYLRRVLLKDIKELE